MHNKIFDNLFVLEIANNHWGSIERGKQIIDAFAEVVNSNKIKAAFKLQFRNIGTFIHKNFNNDGAGIDLNALPKRSRYIQKISKTNLCYNEMKELVEHIRSHNCIPMSTPFDEKSVSWCVKMDLPIIKVASSDINDWLLLNKIAATKKPVILSTGGANEKQIDDAFIFFKDKNIPIAINHCISKYPSENNELELNQIDYLIKKYPQTTIGFSTHEYQDWHSSMYISYAKGARTWERHIDIPYHPGYEQKEVSKYCSLPHQIDEWFKTFNKTKIMCGATKDERRVIDEKETNYLESLYRGLYLRFNLKKGEKIDIKYLYSAIPYQKEIGHITSRQYFNGDYVLTRNLEKDSPLTEKDIKNIYDKNI